MPLRFLSAVPAASGRRRALQALPQLFQRPLFDARYIGPGDAEGRGDLPLGQGDGAAQPVPQADDLRLPGGQPVPHQLVQPQGAVPVVDVVQHGVVHAHHVHQLEGVALLVRLDGVGQGHLALELLLAAEVHQHLIRYPLLTDT